MIFRALKVSYELGLASKRLQKKTKNELEEAKSKVIDKKNIKNPQRTPHEAATEPEGHDHPPTPSDY